MVPEADVVLSLQEGLVAIEGRPVEEVEAEIHRALSDHDGADAVVESVRQIAELHFSTQRSPAVWAAGTLLPLLAGLLVLIGWQATRRTQQARLAQLSAAQRALAGVVLELDTLELRLQATRAAMDDQRVDADDATAATTLARLEEEHREIQAASLRLAREEIRLILYFQLLERPHTDSRLPARHFQHRRMAADRLETFAESVEELQARADALVDATELRAGHAESASVLGTMAAPLVASVDEILRHRTRFPRLADELEEHRDDLLALTTEAGRLSSSDDGEAADLVAHHAELLDRWDHTERRITDVCRRIRRRVSAGGIRRGPRVLREDAARRVRERVNAATAGARRSRREYREVLGLPIGADGDPMRASERALEKIQRRDRVAAPDDPRQGRRAWACLGILLLPAAAALLVAWIVVGSSAPAGGGDGPFLLVAFTAWMGICTMLLLIRAGVRTARHRVHTRRVRRQLAGLRSRIDELALGLDLSRLDMVAVLGGDSPTAGRAEEADQRLHEAALVTAWREVQALERLPRREQRGEDWESRVVHVEKLIDTLAARETDVTTRAEELLRTQREG
ncbi:hypothetical protein [Nesterenkonia suensis]